VLRTTFGTKIKVRGAKLIEKISLALLVICPVIAFLEGGLLAGFIAIPFWILANFLTALAVIPVFGVIAYAIGVPLLFSFVQNIFNIRMPIASNLLFFYHLGITVYMSIVATAMLLYVLRIRKELKQKAEELLKARKQDKGVI